MKMPTIAQRGVRSLRESLAWIPPYGRAVIRYWEALSMQAKLSVLFAGLILTMTGFFYGFAVFQTTREIKISAIYRGQAIAEALKGEVGYGIQSKSFSNLNLTFHRLASSRNDIAYVFLLDSQGLVLANSEPGRVGEKLLDPLTRKSLGATSMRVQFGRVDVDGQGDFSELCDVAVPILIKGKRLGTLRVGVSYTQYLQANSPRIRQKIAFFVLPFAILSILIAFKLAKSYTKPLQRLAQATSEISKGNYNVQLPLNRRDELGEVAHAFNLMAQNVKENFAKVSEMANRDGLTGLYNARFFQEALARELDRVKRSGRPLSVIIFDADRFKKVNDRYGHPVGDQILQHLSHLARSVLRGYDVMARYGGEEFIVMLTDTTGSQAVLMAERMRKMIEQRPLLTDEGDTIRATVSVGVATARAPYEKKELISEADQALYRAKETGRNKVVLFKPLVRATTELPPVMPTQPSL
jgi:diguanylate cyclase (GGDEF)-like protein